MVSDRHQQAYSYYRKSLSYVFDVILEYQMLNNEFTYDRERYRELFQVNTNFVNMDQWFWYMCTESIHPDDTEAMDIFRDMDVRKRISNNNNIIYKTVRIKNQQKGYIWVKLTIIFIPNQRNTNIDRVFIFIKNIDEETCEKMNTLSMAREDSLTGIWNRYYTEMLINKQLAKVQTGIFILLDVDKFKQVNDCYGHITGDEILVSIARRVSNVISNEDVFGRIGGDEFVLFLAECGAEKENMARISRIMNAIQFDYSEFGLDMSIHCSAGVTNVGPTRNSFNDLYAIADKALYEAKAAGRNTFRIMV
jgi:diguanylate cyclase (GGDEF)-like protein